MHNARNKIKKVGPLTTEEIEAQKKFWEEKAKRQGEASEKYDADRMQPNLQRKQSRLPFAVPANVMLKGKWQYIFLFSHLKEQLKLFNNFFYRFFISRLFFEIF